MTTRRSLLLGLTGFVACAPAIVRASSLMSIKALPVEGVRQYVFKDLDSISYITITSGGSGYTTSPVITMPMRLEVRGTVTGHYIR